MKAVILTIGDEILYGDTVDTNASWLGKELTAIGIEIIGRITTGDQPEEILKAFARAEQDADLVIVTGGLGPTNDDKTKDCLCTFFDTHQEENAALRKKVESYYISRKRSLEEVTDKMTFLPVAAEVLANNYGVAPGLWFTRNQKHFIALPGIPLEMKGIMTDEAIPRMLDRFALRSVQHRYFMTAGRGETVLANRIQDIESNLPSHISLAYLPSFSRVIVRLSGKSDDSEQLTEELNHLADQIRPHLVDVTYSEKVGDTLVHALANLSEQSPFKIGLAESCTGGNIMHQITSLSGSSKFFEGGFVSYSNEMKREQLGVQGHTIHEHGAVSEPTVKEMVEGTLSALDCDFALSVSGIAGPTGGTAEKPVGTVCFAVGNRKEIITKTFTFAKNREKNINLATMVGLNLLFRFIKDRI